jgi:hypothetical protein
MENSVSTNKYNEILREIIAEVKMTRIVVANRLSASITQLYWNIGRRLSIEKLEKGYGGRVVEQLSADLKSEFPNTEGFSPRSLLDMKRLYEFYTDGFQISPQPVAECRYPKPPQPVAVLPWGHNRLILSKIKDKQEALYYAQAAVKMGWTRDLLLNFIKADTYRNAKVIAEYNKMKESARAFGTLIRYLGFKTATINVKHAERFEGKSTYTLTKMLRLTLDVTLSNSNKPLKLTVQFGFMVSLFSFLLALYNIIAKLTGIIEVSGYTTTVFSIWFVGGLILFVLGVVGLYISKIFDQVKERQLFIVGDEINIEI